MAEHPVREGAAGDLIPSESEPEHGEVCWAGVSFGEAVRFVDEDGTHVIRSLEFDVYGEGDTLREAVGDYCHHADALFEYLADLADSKDATSHDLEVAAALGQRLLRAWEEIANQLENRSVTKVVLDAALRSRPSSERRRLNWHPQTPRTSSHALPV